MLRRAPENPRLSRCPLRYGTVAAEALRARAVDRLVLLVAPALLGGDAVAAMGPLGLRRVRDAVRVGGLAVARVGPDLVFEGRVR